MSTELSNMDEVFQAIGADESFTVIRPQIVCKDGFVVSVQASRTHFCSPRSNQGPYRSVEVGFPTQRPEPWTDWESYAEDPSAPTETVYGYVPTELVWDLLQDHGGVVGELQG